METSPTADVVLDLFALGAYAALQSPIRKRFAAWLAGLGRRDRAMP